MQRDVSMALGWPTNYCLFGIILDIVRTLFGIKAVKISGTAYAAASLIQNVCVNHRRRRCWIVASIADTHMEMPNLGERVDCIVGYDRRQPFLPSGQGHAVFQIGEAGL